MNLRRIEEIPEGQVFVLEAEIGNLDTAVLYLRADHIEGYPTSVALVLRHPQEDFEFSGAFPGLVARHMRAAILPEADVRKMLDPDVVRTLDREKYLRY
ncbi:MAG TPA: hypothetical protein VGE35_01025 [Candidatus Paceibacterota bacterium]